MSPILNTGKRDKVNPEFRPWSSHDGRVLDRADQMCFVKRIFLIGTAVGILDQNGTRRRTACTARSRGKPR